MAECPAFVNHVDFHGAAPFAYRTKAHLNFEGFPSDLLIGYLAGFPDYRAVLLAFVVAIPVLAGFLAAPENCCAATVAFRHEVCGLILRIRYRSRGRRQ